MVRTVSFLLVLTPLSLLGQQTEVLDRHLLQESVCGPIAIRAQMVDASDMGIPSQRVKITLKNLASKPIVLERYTIHFHSETPSSQDGFGTESQLEVGPGQETAFAQTSSVPDPISYVVFNSVKYADGSTWHPGNAAVCKVIPGSLRE
jgi:hypothetical protein